MSSHIGVPSPMPGTSSTASSNAPSETPRTIFSRSHLNETYSSTSMGVSEENIRRILKPGLYVPTLAFFKDNEELDDGTIGQHAIRMARAGVMGIIVQGTYGEAAHLSHMERCKVTRTTRHAVATAGYPQLPVIVGCGAQTTSEAIELCHDAKSSGGDCALVLPPSAYKSQYTKDALKGFFTDIAGASPIPILLYNYPSVTGIELDSNMIIDLAEHPNIIGCKLTCNDMGKLNRITAATSAATSTDPGSGFMCFAGSADATVQALVGGASGVIAGLANIAPKTCVKLVELHNLGQADEARGVQAAVARADLAIITSGIVGAKSALKLFHGYGGFARRPLPRPGEQEVAGYANELKEIVDMENSL